MRLAFALPGYLASSAEVRAAVAKGSSVVLLAYMSPLLFAHPQACTELSRRAP